MQFIARVLLPTIALSIVAAIAEARADEVIGAPPAASVAAPNAPPPSSTESIEPSSVAASTQRARWYGWQTLTTDGGSLLLFAASGQAKSVQLALAGFGTYIAGGPIVHWAHRNVGRGFASLGIRAGAPILLGVAGAGAASRSSSASRDDVVIGAALGAALGMCAAIAVDAAVIARDHAPAAPSRDSARIAPSIAPLRGGGAIGGLSGAF